MRSARSLCLVVGARSLGEVAADYVPGDVVHIPEGPFQGVCAVVREVDSVASRLQVDALVKVDPTS